MKLNSFKPQDIFVLIKYTAISNIKTFEINLFVKKSTFMKVGSHSQQ